MNFELRQINHWSYYCLPELEQKGVPHGFFTRQSPSVSVSGAEDNGVFQDAFSLKDVVIMDQAHKDEVHVVRAGERPTTGDGILMMERDTAGIIKTADCLPVIIVDASCPMAAIVHAGWRGTVLRITQKAVEKMVALGAKREHLAALLGPSIRLCCYEVGEEVRDAFEKEGFSEGVFERRDDATYLDLAVANREVLKTSGIEAVYDTGLCTFCTEGLFASYRRGDKRARQINFVSLKG